MGTISEERHVPAPPDEVDAVVADHPGAGGAAAAQTWATWAAAG